MNNVNKYFAIKLLTKINRQIVKNKRTEFAIKLNYSHNWNYILKIKIYANLRKQDLYR